MKRHPLGADRSKLHAEVSLIRHAIAYALKQIDTGADISESIQTITDSISVWPRNVGSMSDEYHFETDLMKQDTQELLDEAIGSIRSGALTPDIRQTLFKAHCTLTDYYNRFLKCLDLDTLDARIERSIPLYTSPEELTAREESLASQGSSPTEATSLNPKNPVGISVPYAVDNLHSQSNSLRDRFEAKIGKEAYERIEARLQEIQASPKFQENWQKFQDLVKEAIPRIREAQKQADRELESWGLPAVSGDIEKLYELASLTGRNADPMTYAEVVDWAIELKREVAIRRQLELEEGSSRVSPETTATKQVSTETPSSEWDSALSKIFVPFPALYKELGINPKTASSYAKELKAPLERELRGSALWVDPEAFFRLESVRKKHGVHPPAIDKLLPRMSKTERAIVKASLNDEKSNPSQKPSQKPSNSSRSSKFHS